MDSTVRPPAALFYWGIFWLYDAHYKYIVGPLCHNFCPINYPPSSSASPTDPPRDHFLFRKLTLMVFLHHKWCWCCLNAHEIMCYFYLQGYNQFVDLGCAYIYIPLQTSKLLKDSMASPLCLWVESFEVVKILLIFETTNTETLKLHFH